jgi:hypothetical protein
MTGGRTDEAALVLAQAVEAVVHLDAEAAVAHASHDVNHLPRVSGRRWRRQTDKQREQQKKLKRRHGTSCSDHSDMGGSGPRASASAHAA